MKFKKEVLFYVLCALCAGSKRRVLTICFLVVLLFILFGPGFRISFLLLIIFHVLVLLLFLSLSIALLLSTLGNLLSLDDMEDEESY